MSVKPPDKGLERLRVMVGLTLIVVCGSILWQRQLKPVFANPQTNVWESRDKVRDKYLEWLQEKSIQEKRLELIEAEKVEAKKKALKNEEDAARVKGAIEEKSPESGTK